MLILEALVGLHRTIQLQLLHHYWLGYGYVITGQGMVMSLLVMALSECFCEPLISDDQKVSLARLSLWLCPFRHLEDSRAWGPSCFTHQALKGPPWMGS